MNNINKMFMLMFGFDDPECSIRLGSDVEKSYGEIGDMTPLGSKGIVRGSLKFEDNELYLVSFDPVDANNVTFIIGKKLKKI